MADPLSMLASAVAVAGLATRITKSLDDLAGRWENTGLSLFSLKTLVATFTACLTTLSEWMKREYQISDASTDLTFVRSLAVSTEGCMRFLMKLQNELDIIGHKSGSLPWNKKATIMWNENRIKDLRDHLMCQTAGLKLLLEIRHLVQHQDLMIQQLNQQILDDVRKDTIKLRQDESGAHFEPSGSKIRLGSSAETIEIREEVNGYLPFLSQVAEVDADSSSSLQANNFVNDACTRKIREDYQKKLSKDSDFLVPECPRLRILILGKAGVGKSTLSSEILGISYKQAGVSHGGSGTHIGKIWDEVFGPDQPNLILHDSGGYQPDSTKEMQTVKDFIESRKESLLRDQLHCIWYCIPSGGTRNILDVDKKFFEEIDTGQIPIFVIFTQYDELITKNESESDDESTSPHRSSKQRFQDAEEPAFKQFETDLEAEVLKLAKGKPQVKTCRIAIIPPKRGKNTAANNSDIKGKEYKLQKFRVKELTGTRDLTQAVGEVLDKDGLKDLWIAIQKNKADLKLKASWQGCIDQWWRVQKVNKIPIVPIICMWTLADAYDVILRRLTKIWGLRTNPKGLLSQSDNLGFRFLEATYHETKAGLYFNSAVLATYNLGPLVASQIAKITLKMIVGISLIFERLFIVQQKQGEHAEPLTLENIREEALKFQQSLERSRMSNSIETSIVRANCNQEAAAKRAASLAISLGTH